MFINNTNPWNMEKTQNVIGFVHWHCVVIPWSPLIHFRVLMQQAISFLFLPPSHFLPGYRSLPDCLVLPSVTHEFLPMNSTAVWFGRRGKLPKATCWECSPPLENREVCGTKELLSRTALTGRLTKSHHPRFASSSDTWLHSRVSPKSKLQVMLCYVIG